MPGDVVLFQPPKHLQEYAGKTNNSDLTQGVQASFAVVSFKGKVWRVKYQGEERIIKNREGDPASSLVAVIVKSSPNISKIYYPGSYAPGDDAPPDCFSIDGVKPDPGALKPQSATCANCPHNVWGSKVTEQGSKTKACADSRRVAIVPYPDLKNEAFGGPLLLRVPPASLQEIYRYGKYLDDMGVNYNMLVTKISFDSNVEYPRLTFSVMEHPETGQPIWMDEEQIKTIMELRNSDVIERMLSEAPITEAGDTVAAEAAPSAPTNKEPSVQPGKPEETASPAEPPAQAESAKSEPSAGSAETAAPKEGEEKSKPSAKEANAAEAQPAGDELETLIGNLL